MLQALLQRIMPLVFAVMLLFVPREEYERKVEQIPGMLEKNAGTDLQGWSYEQRYSARLGAYHYYYRYPAGDSLRPPYYVMLHGLNSDGRVFLNMTDLADRYTLIAYDYPGDSPLYHGAFEDYACLLDDFFRAMNIDTTCLLGFSLGGGIGIHYAGSRRDVHITRLILVSGSVFGADEEVRERLERTAEPLLKLPDYKLYYLLEKTGSLWDRRVAKEDMDQEIRTVRDPAWYRQAIRATLDYDGGPYARNVECPVLAIHGTEDRVIPLQRAKRLITTYLPHARYEILEGKGHALPFHHGGIVSEMIFHYCDSLKTASPVLSSNQ